MSVHEHPTKTVGRAPLKRNPRMTIARLFLRAVRGWQRGRAIATLEPLSDPQLEDIGITRNDIPRVVDGLFRAEEDTSEDAPPSLSPQATDPLQKAA